MVIQKALYYPFPFVQNEEWLKYIALYWEKLIRIIPKGFFEAYINGKRITSPSDTEKALVDEFQFIEDYQVGQWDFTNSFWVELDPTFKAANQLVCFLRQTEHKYPALFKKIVSDKREYFSWGVLEPSKLGYCLAEELKGLGVVTITGTKHIRFREFAGKLYMTFLASNIANRIGCPVITDDEEHDILLKMASLSYSTNSLQGRFSILQKRKTRLEALACLNFLSVGVKNFDQVAPKKIVTFRKKYEEERFAYLDSLFNIVSKLNTEEIHSEKQLNNLLHDMSKRLNQNCRDIESALKGLKLQTIPYLIGVSTTVPLLSELSKVINISNPILTVGASATGIVGILVRTKVEREKIFRGNRAGAYLFHLKEEFNKSDYCHRLIKKLIKFTYG